MQQIKQILGIDDQANPEAMPFSAINTLTFLSVAMGVILLASNLVALKVWDLFGIPVDAGIWLFPLTYIVGDLLVEIYGKKVANLVSLYCTIFALVVAGIMLFAKVVLPDFPGVDNSAFDIIQGATGRIFLASVAGFIVGQIINNGIFAWMRAKQKSSARFLQRALLSSVVAHFFDSLVFETLAFVGRVQFGDFLVQMTFAYVAGILLETVFSPVTALLARWLRTRLRYENGKRLN